MAKGFRLIILFLIPILINIPVYAQGRANIPEKQFNNRYRSIPLIKRLSYENFKNIKLLHTAIINFGGGEAEFDKLVDDYANASALYFSNMYVESANMFTKNNNDIMNTAKKLAKRYKEVTENLHKDVIKMRVRSSIKIAFKGKKIHPTMERVISDGAHSLSRANDYEVRARPIEAIYYYRRAKTNYFIAYEVTTTHLSSLALKSRKHDDKEFYTKLSEKYKFPEKYKKDIIDNQNKIYQVREKKK